jgi:predicted enzyme related to lactoylglutathione lyase
MSKYAPGTQCWVDLASPDVDASVDFYGKLMGWTTTGPSLELAAIAAFSRARPTSRA